MELKTEPMEEEGDNHQSTVLSRLGQCQQCGTQEAKYKCPRCEATSCCLDCVRTHKKATECNGQRNRTAYKSLSQFTELDLLSGQYKFFWNVLTFTVYNFMPHFFLQTIVYWKRPADLLMPIIGTLTRNIQDSIEIFQW